jgi:hypothetical protein
MQLPRWDRGALKSLRADAWPIVQATGAAMLAWVIAKQVGQHPDPFFAPIAAVIALNASRGERGLNALRLLTGVVLGIGVGEVTVLVVDIVYVRVALAALVSMVVAHLLGGVRIVVAQAASAAILTVAVADESGVDRLIDALIGAGVALTFSQLLFTPEPLAMLRRAESTALSGMAEALALTARALEHGDEDMAEDAMSKLRSLRDDLVQLGRTRAASTRVVRHSLVWRSRLTPVVQEKENAGHLDLLGGSCLMVTRNSMAIAPDERETLAPYVRQLAEALEGLAARPGDRPIRQQACDRALETARDLVVADVSAGSPLAAGMMAASTVAIDIMVFSGVDPQSAFEAVRHGSGNIQVAHPPATPRWPFNLGRWWRRRRRTADG